MTVNSHLNPLEIKIIWKILSQLRQINNWSKFRKNRKVLSTFKIQMMTMTTLAQTQARNL